MADKRRLERVSARLFAQIELSGQKEPQRAVVVDANVKGIAVETEGNLVVGEVVTLHVEIPLKLRAKVVRQQGQAGVKKFGLRFSDLSWVDKFILRFLFRGRLETTKI